MNKEQFAIYEKTPQHGKDYNGVILAPFNTKEEAEIAGKKYGYYGDNYYVDILDYNKKSKIINKEQQELLDESYKNYMKWAEEHSKTHLYEPYTQEEFINKCKTDTEFSEKWGLKIEERELSHDERFRIAYKNLELRKKLEVQSKMLHYPDGHNKVMDDANIPTKLNIITYNDKTIESYE